MNDQKEIKNHYKSTGNHAIFAQIKGDRGADELRYLDDIKRNLWNMPAWMMLSEYNIKIGGPVALSDAEACYIAMFYLLEKVPEDMYRKYSEIYMKRRLKNDLLEDTKHDQKQKLKKSLEVNIPMMVEAVKGSPERVHEELLAIWNAIAIGNASGGV